MFGSPEDTEETVEDTINYSLKLPNQLVQYSVFTPYPGSDLFYECQKDGIIKEDFDLSIYNHQSPLNCFTKNISKERFYELRKEADKFVERYNAKAKFRRGLKALKNIGIKATFRKVYSHFYSRLVRYNG